MLGRLARRLRELGFDTASDATLPDARLVQWANDERRVLLTRDRRLLRELQPARALEVRGDQPLAQLQQVVAALALAPPASLFTRCLLCNAALSPPVTPDEAARLVPPGVRETPGPVRVCPTCGRAYWLGSHARRMRDALERALPGWAP